MSYEESCGQAFPLDKIILGMLDSKMIEDSIRIVDEAINEKIQVRLNINIGPAATPP